MFNFILAAAEAAPKAAKAQNPFMQMIPIFLIVIVFMFFMSRSQRKQQQKREEMLNALVIAPNVCVEVAKNGVAEVVSEEPAK